MTEWLRGRSDAQLSELLRRRPDLGLPAPADLATLASRLSVRTSVQRAVDGLDAWRLRVLEAVALSQTARTPPNAADARDLLGSAGIGAGAQVAAALDDLRTLTLVWGDDDHLHLVAGVADAIGPYPAGLGRPADVLLAACSDVTIAPMLRSLGLPPGPQPRAGASIAAVLQSARGLSELLAACDETEREVLARLATGPPVGLVRDARSASEQTPPHRLIRRALLIPIDGQTVELPREVGLNLRGNRRLGTIEPAPPVIASADRTPAEADRSGTTAVLEVLRLVSSLGTSWTARPPALLRGGGVGVRELRRTARELDVDESTTALVIEIASAAGLLASTSGTEPVFLPTPEFDIWARREPAPRWVTLAASWLAMTRQPSLVSQRDERERLITVLGPDAERGTIATLRRHVLSVLATLEPGLAPVSRSSVLDRLAWESPRRSGAQRPMVEAILAEADVLGVTAAGGLTSYSRALLAGATSAAEDALMIALPEPVDHFVLQPDLTVVVPGPPTPELAGELDLVADLESSGGASVYRITEGSVRRALDAGRTATDLAALFATHSRTPVPQALSYLVDDVGRRHGVLRSGVATAYLRCDDEALLSRVLADRHVAALGLRRIAPTVPISGAPVARLLDVLRDAGYAPAAEAPDGGLVSLTADAPRAPSRPSSRLVRMRPPAEASAHVAELVRRIRSGDSLAELARRSRPISQQIPGVTSATTLGLLRDAIRGGQSVWLGFVDAEGTASQHTILPISLAGGVLRGHEPSTKRLQSYPLHRITAVSVLDDD